VAVIEAGPKPVASTGGMLHTAATSPYYSAWVGVAESSFNLVREGVLARDFEQVALGMEHSTRLMHATMLSSVPPVIYLKGATIELMHAIPLRRSAGHPEAYTMDAGPNVKVLTVGSHINETVDFLKGFPGVRQVLVCRPGPAAQRLVHHGPLGEALAGDSLP